jgi:hypothetical protein
MSTKRTPVRPARKQGPFPPEALDTFNRMQELEAKRCRCKPRPDDIPYWKHWPRCRRCEEWDRLDSSLSKFFQRKIWEVGTIGHADEPCPDRHSAPGPYPVRDWERRTERRRQLEAALAQHRKRH